jgi:hypothetical protein
MSGDRPHPEPVRIALAHAAGDWGLSVDDIAVERVEPVDWPDAALGVPEPGMFYAQMITPGYRVRLRAGQRARVYHTDSRERVVVAGDITETG